MKNIQDSYMKNLWSTDNFQLRFHCLSKCQIESAIFFSSIYFFVGVRKCAICWEIWDLWCDSWRLIDTTGDFPLRF